jgi:hypothetical protein
MINSNAQEAHELQTTDKVLMISPDTFQFNEQTAATNSFQKDLSAGIEMKRKVMKEFAGMVSELRAHHIHVITLSSRADVATPDAVFPNNWFSTHTANGERTIIIYPMLAESRRLERQYDVLVQALQAEGIRIQHKYDLTRYEAQERFLEGTGSMVLDRINRIVYAALSPRTDQTVLDDFAETMNYTSVVFHSCDKQGNPVYHTNVVMSLGRQFAVIALDAVSDQVERDALTAMLKMTHKNIINITLDQMENMAGNILEVRSVENLSKIILSATAYNAFTPAQRQLLSTYGELVVVHIETIERLGGGSARCMLAEIF